MTSGMGSPEVAPAGAPPEAAMVNATPEAAVGDAPPEAAGADATPEPVGTAAATRWTRASRPRLPSKVRLQWDEPRNQAMLLFPEGVLMLNPTAHAVLGLVDGTRSLGQIVTELTRKFDAAATHSSEAEAVDLSTDPGTDGGEHESVAAAPGARAAGAPPTPAEREAQIERDVVVFLSTLEARGWLTQEPAA